METSLKFASAQDVPDSGDSQNVICVPPPEEVRGLGEAPTDAAPPRTFIIVRSMGEGGSVLCEDSESTRGVLAEGEEERETRMIQFNAQEDEIYQRLIQLSFAKIVNSKHERGGAKLHKSMLVLHLLKRARNEQRRSLSPTEMECAAYAEQEEEVEEEGAEGQALAEHHVEEEDEEVNNNMPNPSTQAIRVPVLSFVNSEDFPPQEHSLEEEGDSDRVYQETVVIEHVQEDHHTDRTVTVKCESFTSQSLLNPAGPKVIVQHCGDLFTPYSQPSYPDDQDQDHHDSVKRGSSDLCPDSHLVPDYQTDQYNDSQVHSSVILPLSDIYPNQSTNSVVPAPRRNHSSSSSGYDSAGSSSASSSDDDDSDSDSHHTSATLTQKMPAPLSSGEGRKRKRSYSLSPSSSAANPASDNSADWEPFSCASKKTCVAGSGSRRELDGQLSGLISVFNSTGLTNSAAIENTPPPCLSCGGDGPESGHCDPNSKGNNLDSPRCCVPSRSPSCPSLLQLACESC